MAKILFIRRSLMESTYLNDVEKHVLTSLMSIEYCTEQYNANPENADTRKELKATYEYIASAFNYTSDDVLRAMLFLEHKGYSTHEMLSKYQFKFELNHKKIDKHFPT